MMGKNSFLGIDLGTSSVKLLLADETGAVLAEASASYPVYGREEGFYEQKPSDWTAAICRAAGELRERVSDSLWLSGVRAVGLSAQMPTLVLMTAEGGVRGNAVVWCDNRAAAEGKALLDKWGAKRHYETTGVFLDGRYLVPMYRWIETNRPSLLKEEHYMLSAKDYIYHWLSGEIATDPSTASGYGVYDLAGGCWSMALIGEAGLDPGIFPKLRDSFDCSAVLRPGIAGLLGLSETVRIACGGADSVAGVFGMGGSEEGTVCLICGSSTAIVGIRENFTLNAENAFFVTPLLKAGSAGMEADILSTGNTQSWLLARINEMREAPCAPFSHKDLSRIAAEAPAGSDGLLFMPYLSGGEQGVLWDDKLSGACMGLRLSHRMCHVIRACYEGVCFETLRCLNAFRGDGYEVKRVVATGPAASDPFFMQLTADILGVTCFRSNVRNASACGAARLALQSLSAGEGPGFDSRAAGAAGETGEGRYDPDPELHRRYEEIYGVYEITSRHARTSKAAR